MNLHLPEIDRSPSRDEAEAALDLLRRWAGHTSDAEIAALDPSVRALAGAARGHAPRARPSVKDARRCYRRIPANEYGTADMG